MSFFVMTIWFGVPIAGILLNGYVLAKLLKIARKSVVRFETTSGLPLAAMSIGDSITLASLLMQAMFHNMLPKENWPKFVLSATCKFGIYSMHTTSAFSVWCWLVLSVLRYIAVFHPIKYRTIWRQPRNALKILALCVCIFESYILFIVTYQPKYKACAEYEDLQPRNIKIAHLSDIFLFYAIPSLLRIILDFIVLVHCYAPFSMDRLDRMIVDRRYAISGPTAKRYSQSVETESLDNKNNVAMALSIAATTQSTQKPKTTITNKKGAMVMRSIVISVLNLFLNLPSHILRAWATVDNQSLEYELVRTLEPISQMLYFSQFACNAFYLATSIYETNGSPRNTVIASSHRHVSRCISEDEG